MQPKMRVKGRGKDANYSIANNLGLLRHCFVIFVW